MKLSVHKVRRSRGVVDSPVIKEMSKVLFWPKDASGKQENGGASISQRIGQIRYLQEWGMSSARQQQRLKCPQHFLTV